MPNPLVLIVEDNFLVAESTSLVLKNAGYRVATAATAKDALSSAAAERPDVALVDLNLGDGMTGAAVANQLRKLDCAIVVCTGYAGATSQAWLSEFGPAAVLTKPAGEEDLLAAVAAALPGALTGQVAKAR